MITIIAHKSNLIQSSDYIYLIKDKVHEEGTFEDLISNKNNDFNLLYS